MGTARPVVPDWITTNFPDLQNITSLTSGGQKIVFRADHPTDGQVVLKIIDVRQDGILTEREILAVASVQAQRVPSIYEHGTIATPFGNNRWIRERYIAGANLREILATGTFSCDSLRKLTRHILEALIGAEAASIVHRDIKPENIIRDNADNYWLIDFGIARHLTLSSLTATGALWGKLTLGYAPKEQTRNEKLEIDSRADLFALGITVVELYTGTNPFRHLATSDLEIVRRVESFSVPNPFTANQLESDFGDLICTMLQRRRDLRPRNAAAALEWLDEIEARHGVT